MEEKLGRPFVGQKAAAILCRWNSSGGTSGPLEECWEPSAKKSLLQDLVSWQLFGGLFVTAAICNSS